MREGATVEHGSAVGGEGAPRARTPSRPAAGSLAGTPGRAARSVRFGAA